MLEDADGKMQPTLLGKLGAGKDLAQAADLRLGLAEQQNFLAAPGIVELFADPSMRPLKRSTDSIGRRQVVSSEPVAMAEAVTEGNCTARRMTSATL